MRSYDHKHPKGNKYSETELRRHRDSWNGKVKGNIGLANQAAVVETDKKVYQLLVKILPWNGSIDFIKNNNFAGGSFIISNLNDLYEFKHNCINPAFEFIDPDLEGLRANLLALINGFTMTIGYETFPTHNEDLNSVPEEWEYEQPERFKKVVNELHDTARKICEIYSDLVKTATRKLGLLPVSMEKHILE